MRPCFVRPILLTLLTSIMIICLALYYAMNIAALAEDQSNRLIHAILPARIVERLKSETRQAVAENHPWAVVLVADVTGFTAFAHGRPASEVVMSLDQVFTAFDAIADKYGLEKIKTVGDGYLATAGLLEHAPDPAGRAVRAGLSMITQIAQTPLADDAHLSLRVGVHAGPVTSGVIGRARLAFDIWGDTVNTAFRIQDHAAPGHLVVSQAVKQELPEATALTAMGNRPIRGIGALDLWQVDGLSEMGQESSQGVQARRSDRRAGAATKGLTAWVPVECGAGAKARGNPGYISAGKSERANSIGNGRVDRDGSKGRIIVDASELTLQI